jgi:phosphate transport system substrate-binding protein
MPKPGTSLRTLIAGAAVTALAAVAVVTVAAAPAKHGATTIKGAGSTFVAPLVSTWIPAVSSAVDVELQYSSIGSGGGIAAITGRTVDFGASDAPLTPDQWSACNGCVQIPWGLAGTSVLYNLPGATNLLRIDGPTLAKIYLGQITSWNDQALKKLNPKVSLPDQAITVVHRSDGSGTTYNFADYLGSVSSAWRTKVGPASTALDWPAGVGGRGSSGVAAAVASTPGAIGYADFAYALSSHLKYFRVKNSYGNFTLPGRVPVQNAASSGQKPDAHNAISIVNPSRVKNQKLAKKLRNAYPISTYTYVIAPVQTSNAAALKSLFTWAVTTGQTGRYTAKLRFVPLPTNVVTVAKKAIASIHS